MCVAALAAAVSLLAGCGATKVVATTDIPIPLVVKVPATVALYIPQEFSQYVHNEKRWNTEWSMDLGTAQSQGLTKLVNSMFEHVVPVASIEAGANLGEEVSAILEPSVEEYAFVTPRDAGSPFYAVSVKYRMNVYSADGRLADSWGFTGYGTSPSEGLSSVPPLTRATSLAMRDAGAKLAVEFREQAMVRDLIPGTGPATSSAEAGGGAAEAPEVAGGGEEKAAVANPPASGAAPAVPAASTAKAEEKQDGNAKPPVKEVKAAPAAEPAAAKAGETPETTKAEDGASSGKQPEKAPEKTSSPAAEAAKPATPAASPPEPTKIPAPPPS